MTPLAKPSMASKKAPRPSRPNTTRAAPDAVSARVPRPATNAWSQGARSANAGIDGQQHASAAHVLPLCDCFTSVEDHDETHQSPSHVDRDRPRQVRPAEPS